MSKTLTTYEALKANETKRVRAVGSEAWWGVNKMIEMLNEAQLEFTRPVTWEAEEPLIEQWVVVNSDGKVVANYDTEEEARAVAKGRRVVNLREVRP